LQIYPSYQEFVRLAKKGNLVPLVLETVADSLTPVSILSSEWNKSPYCFLLESVEGGESLGRYSVISFNPDAVVEENNGVSQFLTVGGKPFLRYNEPALNALERYMKCVKPVDLPGLPRFYGGAVGYLSYETIQHMEKIPSTASDPLKWPVSTFLITGDLVVFDNTQQLIKIIQCVRIPKNGQLKNVYAQAKAQLLKRLDLLRKTSPIKQKKYDLKNLKQFKSNVSEKEFKKSVEVAKEYIGKGDIIQVVLSRRQEKTTKASPIDIYRSLRVVNPSPYMFLVKLKDRAIIGSSPEPLVRLENGEAMTRPIAGTRKRGESVNKDLALEKELLKDPKERAEHLMLVDLGRNDLGRVCNFGSVHVPKFMIIERYSHVMHIVSEIRGRLKKGKTAFDLLKMAFPAGTVSGAPKIRAMEIISELEKEARGPYAGALGYFSYSGNMDMAITIRTLLYDKGKISIQTGAGIVADSIPKKEYQETENKAAGMKKTVEIAETGVLF
jgi:anthranilate synthase component 1